MNHDHIPTKEIEKDIADTQSEIVLMEREERGFRIVGDRWSIMKADYRVVGIKERKAFIKNLVQILKERAESKGGEMIDPNNIDYEAIRKNSLELIKKHGWEKAMGMFEFVPIRFSDEMIARRILSDRAIGILFPVHQKSIKEEK